MDVSPFLNFFSQDDLYRFRHVDDYSLKTNFEYYFFRRRILLERLTLNTPILTELFKCGI